MSATNQTNNRRDHRTMSITRPAIAALVLACALAACGTQQHIDASHNAGIACATDGQVHASADSYGDGAYSLNGGPAVAFHGGFTLTLSGASTQHLVVTADDWPTFDQTAGPCAQPTTSTAKATTTTAAEATTTTGCVDCVINTVVITVAPTTTTTCPDCTPGTQAAPTSSTTTLPAVVPTTALGSTTTTTAPPVTTAAASSTTVVPATAPRPTTALPEPTALPVTGVNLGMILAGMLLTALGVLLVIAAWRRRSRP